MEKISCCVCQKTKALLVCELCENHVCKYCAQFIDETTFSFMTQLPADLAHTTYCGPCFDRRVMPELNAYNEILERAKEIMVFGKEQGKETRLVKRLEDPVKVENCADHNETILRLAFFAAKAGFNAIIDVDVVYKKVRMEAFQTTIWSGTAIPAHVRTDKLIKDRSLWNNPN